MATDAPPEHPWLFPVPQRLRKLAKWRKVQISLHDREVEGGVSWTDVHAAETAVPGLLLQLGRGQLRIMHEKTGASVPCSVQWEATPEGLAAAQTAVAELAAFGDWTRMFGPGSKSDLIAWGRTVLARQS